MALSIEQLTNPVTNDEALEQVLDVMESLGFNARAWQSGTIPRTFVEYMAQFRSDGSVLINDIAKGGLNEISTGPWLTLFSSSHYSNDRTEAKRTEGDVEVTVALGAGPLTIQAGDMVVGDALGNTYRNVNVLNLAAGPAVVSDLFEAEVAGEKANVANDTIATLITGIAGVSVNNPDPGSGSWISEFGADEESDTELRTRNRNKWATRTYASPQQAYEIWALEAEAVVTRAKVDDTNSKGAGKVDVYIADNAGAITAPAVLASVLSYINGGDGVGRSPLTATVDVLSPAEETIPVTLDLVYDNTVFADDAAAKAAVDAAIQAYFASVPIGGVEGDFLSLGGLYSAVFGVPGVVNAPISLPATDADLSGFKVAVLGIITYNSVLGISA